MKLAVTPAPLRDPLHEKYPPFGNTIAIILLFCFILSAVSGVWLLVVQYSYSKGEYADNERIVVWNGDRSRSSRHAAHYGDNYFYYDGGRDSVIHLSADGSENEIYHFATPKENGILRRVQLSCTEKNVYIGTVDQGLFRLDYEGNVLAHNERLNLGYSESRWPSISEVAFTADSKVILLRANTNENIAGLTVADANTLEQVGFIPINVSAYKNKLTDMSVFTQTVGTEDVYCIRLGEDIVALGLFLNQTNTSDIYGTLLGMVHIGNKIYFTEPTKNGPISQYVKSLYRYDISTGEYINVMGHASINELKLYPPLLHESQEKLIAVYVNSDFINFGSTHFDGTLSNHHYDIVYVIDPETGTVETQYQTQRRERILYADTEVAITYYRQQVLTRSMDDWSILETYDTPYVHHDGENTTGNYYSFELTGNRLFIFDGRDRLLDIIPV